MSKYDPLRDYLRRQRADDFELTFADIERRLGAMLPKSANRPQWWIDDGSPLSTGVQCQAWKAAGYEALLIEGKERVRFRKTRSAPDRSPAPALPQ